MNVPFTAALVDQVAVNWHGRWVLIALSVVLGGVFGSFINVVAYRLPRRMSLNLPGSHCPACGRAIRWHDNLPIVGWFKLGGRCRDCGAAIAFRYPLVEALVAVVGGLLAWKASGQWIAEGAGGGDGYAFEVGAFAIDLLLMCALVSAALVEFDGQVPPQRLFWVPLALGLVMLWLWPGLQPESDSHGYEGVPAAIAGMASAIVVGAGPWLAGAIGVRQARIVPANAALAALVMVGGFLGAHAVVTIGVASMVLHLGTQALARKWPPAARFGWAGTLMIVTLFWLLAGRDLSFHHELPAGLVIRPIVGGVIMSALAIVLQIVRPRQRPIEPS